VQAQGAATGFLHSLKAFSQIESQFSQELFIGAMLASAIPA